MEYLRIGLITRPHGVHGALKVQPLSENLTRYKGLREAYLERGGAYEKVEVSDVSVQPDAVYMNISVCRDRNTAETLRNHYISVDREHAVKLPEGRYFVMGDNREWSKDSRLLQEPYIPAESIQGQMLLAFSIGSGQSWQGVRWIG